MSKNIHTQNIMNICDIQIYICETQQGDLILARLSQYIAAQEASSFTAECSGQKRAGSYRTKSLQPLHTTQPHTGRQSPIAASFLPALTSRKVLTISITFM